MIWLAALVGFLLRIAAIRAQGTYWFDEIFSAHFSAMPLPAMMGFLIRDVHPTLYYLLLHFWIGMFGDGESATRTLSAVIGALAVAAVGLVARRTFGKRAGFFAALFAALSPLLIFQSAEARMYPLLVLLVALGTVEFLWLMDDPKRPSWRWAAIMGLACFTHLTALTPFVAMACVRVHALRKDRGALTRFLATSTAVLAPFMAWFAIAASARLAFVGREWQLNGGTDASTPLLRHFTDFFALGMPAWQGVFLCVALVAFVLRAIVSLKSEGHFSWRVELSKDRKTWLLLALALFPFLAFMGVTTAVTKYFVVAFPACAALVAGGADMLLPKSRRATMFFSAAWLALLAVPLSGVLISTRFRYDDATRFIEKRERAGDVVYATWAPSLLPFARYYHGHLPAYAIDPHENEASSDENLVLHAGQALTQKELDDAEAVMGRRIDAAPRVFLLSAATGLAATPVELWFYRHGWTLEDTYRSDAWGPVVYVMGNPKK